MSQVDRETAVPLDPTAQAVDLHNRMLLLEPALRERLGELAVTGATPVEKLDLREARERLSGVEQLARAAIAALDETDVPLRASPEETLAGDEAYAAVMAFVDREGGGFTLAQLKGYLRESGYELPKDPKVFSKQFSDWQQRIVDEKTKPADEATKPEERRWIKLNSRTYVLAWLEAPPAKASPKAMPEPAPTPAPSLPLPGIADSSVNSEPLPQVPSRPPASAEQSERTPEVSLPTTDEDPAAAIALRIVREASGEPAKTLIGQLIGELNISTPTARHVFEELVKGGQIHRHSTRGRVRYSTEPPTPPARAAASPAVESSTTPALPSVLEVLAAERVLMVLSGRGVPFGKAFTPQEISRLIGGDGDPDHTDVSPDEVKSAASYLWSLGLVTRIEGRGKLKLQLANRSIMTGMKSDQGRADIITQLSAGLKYVPPATPAKRRPAKKRL